MAAISAAQKLGGSVTGFIASKGAKAIAEEVAKLKGLEKVIFVDSEAYDKVWSCADRYRDDYPEIDICLV